MKVNAVDVLKKRQDSAEPCDDKLYNEDASWIQNAIKLLNCTPPFFKRAKYRFEANEIPETNTPCNKEKLYEFYAKYTPKSHFKKVAKLYNQP